MDAPWAIGTATDGKNRDAPWAKYPRPMITTATEALAVTELELKRTYFTSSWGL